MKTAALCSAVCLLSTTANATFIDRGNGLIYDSDLDVTWLQDANYAKTSGYSSTGQMTLSEAQNWINSVNSENGGVGHLGYKDWRLPIFQPLSVVSGGYSNFDFNFNYTYNGSTDAGYNISAPGTIYAGSKANEMAYLFYNELGDKGYCNTASTASSCSYAQEGDYGLTNSGPFINMQSGYYWTGTQNDPVQHMAWIFRTKYGDLTYSNDTLYVYAMAVRTGDVAAAPIPAAAWLLGSGLLGLMGVARRKVV